MTRMTEATGSHSVRLLVIVGAAALVGCGGADSQVTFTKDVAPIVFRECASCHRPGESAPFSMLDYREVRQRARLIVNATRSRFMPPWLPEPGYGEFVGERRLTDWQIETLRKWEEQGAQEGDPADLPPVPQFAEGWQLGEPDVALAVPKPYTLPADGTDVWRNFVIPTPASAPHYVKTIELRPGSARFVHHALLGVDSTRSSRRRDAQDAVAGFEGMDMGDAQAPDGHLLGWTPGMAPFPGFEGRAWRLEPGADLVLQLHLLPTGKPETIEPVVGLYFAKAPPSGPPMYLLRLDADHAIDIPPGQKHFVVTDTFELPADVEVLAVYPHAHFLAKTMEGRAILPSGEDRWLIRIDKWDFKWQDVYRYRSPVSLPRGTSITMRYSYDNSAGNSRNPSRPPARVVAGMRSSDEMAHLQLQVQAHSTEDLLRLREALYRHALRKTPRDPWVHYELANVLRDTGRFAQAIDSYRAALELDPGHAPTRNNLGVLLADEGNLAEAIREYREALRAEPDLADAHFNLGNALRATARLNEATAHYRRALRLEPTFAEAHNNLGEVFASERNVEQAIVHFREALRLRPESADAHSNLGAALGLQGKFDEALSHFREALRIEPDHARARANLGKALEAAGRN
jgi:Flp pilus assembly protein TadD